LVLDRDAQADARSNVQLLGRGAKVVARGAVRYASQILDRGAQAIARGAARCLSQLLDRLSRRACNVFVFQTAAVKCRWRTPHSGRDSERGGSEGGA
jgi:hypothetical protein